MPVSIPQESILLCSSPRSGSTFAANLIRSSPDVAFLNEIITRRRFLLPQFTALSETASDGENLRNGYEDDLRRLFAYTLPHGANLVNRNRLTKFAVFGSLKAASSVLTRVGLKGFERNPFYRFYYLNGLHEPFVRPFFESQFPKHRTCRTLLTKEVFLYPSYLSFREMYPRRKVIYLIRDPLRQVASERKHLKFVEPEEKRASDAPKRSPEQERRREDAILFMVDRYGQEEVIRQNYGGSFEQRFSLLWRLDNDAMVEAMNNESPECFLPLRYEDLVADTRSTISKILDFAGIERSANLDRFLEELENFRGRQKHGRSTFVAKSPTSARPESEIGADRAACIQSVISGSIAAARFGYA